MSLDRALVVLVRCDLCRFGPAALRRTVANAVRRVADSAKQRRSVIQESKRYPSKQKLYPKYTS